MPIDGTVWLINPSSIPGEDELTLGATLSGDYTLSAPNDLGEREGEILQYMNPSNITLSSYTYVSNYDEYDKILMNNQDPVILSKDIDGQMLVIFTFSLHNSNLPIIPEYILLMFNLSNYSVKNMVEQYMFYPGDAIEISKKASALSMTVTHNDEVSQYIDFPVTLIAKTPGEYTINQILASGEESTVDFFVRIDRTQCDFDYDYGVLSDPIIPASSDAVDAELDTIDIIYYLTGALLLLMLVEWRLHYNEHN